MSDSPINFAKRTTRGIIVATLGLFAATSVFATPSAVSITSPTASQKFGIPAQVTIAASVTPASGLAITRVEFYLGGSTLIGTAMTSPYSVVWTNSTTGTYSLTARAYDSTGNKTSSAVSIILQTNVAPTVSISSPTAGTSFGSSATVSITATASDTDGTISQVEFFQGTTSLGVKMAPAPFTLTWVPSAAGTYSLTAKATDNSGKPTTSTAVSIKVLAPPTVSITSPANNASFTPGSNIALSATAAAASGTTIKQVAFFRNGTAVGSPDTTSPYSVTWSAVPAGTYALTAVATDNKSGVTTSSPINITVHPPPPTVSITSPANNASFGAGASVTLTATASETGGTISKVEFFSGTLSLGSKTASPFTVSWVPPAPGNYSITAVATDSTNVPTTSGAIAISVLAAPTVSVTAPGNNASFTPGSNITLSATAAAASGTTIKQVAFFQNGTAVGSPDTTSPYSVTWSAVPAGTYALTAVATDNKSGVTTSVPVNITVAPVHQNPTVSISSPVSGAISQAPAAITITAIATPGSGSTIDHVEFYNGATKIGTAPSAPYTFLWPNVASGEYVLTAKAIDSTGAPGTSSGVIAIVDGADSCTNTPPVSAAKANTMFASYGKLPLGFEENAGQSDAQVKFLSRGAGYQLFLTQDSSVLALRADDGHQAALRMGFVNGNAQAAISGLDRSDTNTNYLIGSDPSRWRPNVANYGRVRYASVYPGVDAVYHARQGKLEYDLEVAPNADPDRIRISFDGVESLSIDDKGALVLRTAVGTVEQFKPVAYQSIGGVLKDVQASYRLLDGNVVAFALGGYDRNETLVIDPVLVYSTYLSGSDNTSGATGIALSRCGEAFVTGWTWATTFPTTAGAFDTGGMTSSLLGFVSKLNPSGTALLYSTYLTGTQHPAGDGAPVQFTNLNAIAVDSTGHAFVAGSTNATDFPVTPGVMFVAPPSDPSSVLAKLNTDGNGLIYGTYLDRQSITSIAVDASGNAYVTADNVVRKIAPDGRSNPFNFNVGGSISDTTAAAVAVDAAGNFYVTGTATLNSVVTTAGVFETTRPSGTGGDTGFVTKVTSAGAVVWSTYLGNTGSTQPTAIALDSAGRVYVTGIADGKSFPMAITRGWFNTDVSDVVGNNYAFAARLTANGTSLDYFGWIGGQHCETTCSAAQTSGRAIAVDSSSNVWVAGYTHSNRMQLVKPLNANFSPINGGTGGDSFAVKISSTGTSMLFGTLLNGTHAGTAASGLSDMSATGIQVDSIGSAYVVGRTNATDFPTTPGAFQTVPASPFVSNAFVTKINETKDTTTALAVSPNPSTVGASITLTATVTGNAPTGSVNFLDGTASIGTIAVGNGTAQLVTTSLTGGSHTLTASYAGDAHNNPSVSTAVTESLTNPNGPTITLTGVADGATLIANSGSSYHGLTVTAVGNAASGNQLTSLTIQLDTSIKQWTLFAPSVTQADPLVDLSTNVHTIVASVTDDHSHTTSSSPVRFAVVSSTAGPAPSVAMTSPTNGSTLTGSGPFPLTATATPVGLATITSVKYYAGSANVGTGFTGPSFSASWGAPQAGTYSLVAVATDSTGAMAFSAPITVTVFIPPPPTVTLTSPLDGSSYYTTDVIPLAATASGNAGAMITKVEFYSDNSLIGTAATPPYTSPWTTAPAGSHYIQALAADDRGVTTRTVGNTITVSVPSTPAVAITSPANGASFASPASIPITVNTAAGGGATVARVDFYSGTDLVASSSSAPWGVTWSNVGPGTYQLTAVVTNNSGVTATSVAVSVTVTNAALAISVDSGFDGSTVGDGAVTITGRIQAPPNSSVTANGALGTVLADGRFYVNGVPLTPGSNAITVSVTDPDGNTASQSIAVSSSGAGAFAVTVTPTDGIAPLQVAFSVANPSNAAFTSIEFDINGDGVSDYSAADIASADPVFTLSAGYTVVKVTVKNGSNVIYTFSQPIYVYTAIDRYNLVKGVLSSVLDRLKAGNADSASNLFVESRRTDFKALFANMGASLTTIASQLGAIRGGSLSGHFAELLIVRDNGSGPVAYPVHMVRDADGIWRIEGI